MKRTEMPTLRFRSLFLSTVLSIVGAAMLLSSQPAAKATSGKASTVRQESPELPNYDIRLDTKAIERLAAFRNSMNRSASDVADLRDKFAMAETQLLERVPSVKVEYSRTMRSPEVIAPGAELGRESLTGASGTGRAAALKNFLKRNRDLIGAAEREVENLSVAADYTNPDGNLSFVELKQQINGIPVFQGRVKAGFTKRGEIIRVINNLAPGVDLTAVASDFGDPAEAVSIARAHSNYPGDDSDLVRNEAASTDEKAVFGITGSETTAEKLYFPTEPGVVVPAWRILTWQPDKAFMLIVDAKTGTLLWRKNITEDQAQAATYNVYINPNAMMNVARSPFPMSPGQTSPNGIQAQGIGRTSVTLIGNEAPYDFNNLGWIADGSTTTDGNNVQAGLDRKSPNQGRADDIDPDGMAVGPNRVFDFPFTPGIPTNPAQNGGESPLPTAEQSPNICLDQGASALPSDYQKAATTQLFYIVNRYHDEMYRLGFTEAAGNFQNDNFGRGGLGNDRISAQAQDCLGVNNANFGTPPDGMRPVMQMYLWNAPTPDFDGSLDGDIVVHELTHGLSNRLHGDAFGLNQDMARGMGEGYSDFYALSLLSQPSDPVDGVYPMSGYTTYRLRTGVNEFQNYYYGIRRFPYAIMSATGGAQNRPHNPLTFADIDQNQINIGNGAFAPSSSGGNADQVHRAGEIWCSALWEVRARFIQRLGWEAGNRRILQIVTDGMKLAPIDPTFLSERDAIIAAANAAGSPADVADIWAGFAIRGMGATASIQNVGAISTNGTGTTRVTEAFDLPNLTQAPELTFSDAAGDNDGFAEPGEKLALTIPLSNNTGLTATGVTLQIAGGSSISYGSIAHLGTASNQLFFTVPPDAGCGSLVTLTLNVNSSLGATSFTRTIPVGAPSVTYSENFDGVTAPALPNGWTAAAVNGGTNFVTTTTGPFSAPNSAFALDPANSGGGTDLTSPAIQITAPAATISFRNNFQTETGYDGGVLEISIGGGPFQDIIAAGGSFLQNGYNGLIFGYPNNPNPLQGRSAWTGSSGWANGTGVYLTTTARLPAAAAGQSVRFRWRFGADGNTGVIGWNIDNVQVAGNFTCSFSQGSTRARADFDGDGRSDLSVFRPANNNWYFALSSGGIMVQSWGTATDELAPGDYDGDGKTDIAVFRPDANASFFVLNSNGFLFSQFSWGTAGDRVVTGDFDGDGKDDAAVYRASNNNWYVRKSSGGIGVAVFGQAGDLPLRGDFNGDGKADYGVYRAGEWQIALNGGGFAGTTWGIGSDKPVPADYDGDGTDDFAVFRPSEGRWYIKRSSNSQFDVFSWGIATDVPVPGDYDGDRKADPAVYRDGTWYIIRSSQGINVGGWGIAGDIPVPSKYVP